MKSSLQLSDEAAAAVAKTPNRISLADIEKKISCEYIFTADKALQQAPYPASVGLMTICILVLENGFTVVGKSACADPENFNAELGAKLAREDAVRQVWPLEAYLLREKMNAPCQSPND